jgi:hypothetical protein
LGVQKFVLARTVELLPARQLKSPLSSTEQNELVIAQSVTLNTMR